MNNNLPLRRVFVLPYLPLSTSALVFFFRKLVSLMPFMYYSCPIALLWKTYRYYNLFSCFRLSGHLSRVYISAFRRNVPFCCVLLLQDLLSLTVCQKRKLSLSTNLTF